MGLDYKSQNAKLVFTINYGKINKNIIGNKIEVVVECFPITTNPEVEFLNDISGNVIHHPSRPQNDRSHTE